MINNKLNNLDLLILDFSSIFIFEFQNLEVSHPILQFSYNLEFLLFLPLTLRQTLKKNLSIHISSSLVNKSHPELVEGIIGSNRNGHFSALFAFTF